MVLLDLREEGAKKINRDIIGTVVIIAITREIALYNIIGYETILITYGLNACILDCGKRVNYV